MRLDDYDDTQSPEDRAILRNYHGEGYRPIDELLAGPSTRFPSALRRGAWLTATELYRRAGIESDEQWLHYDRASKALSRLVRALRVTRKGTHGRYSYQITAKGRAELIARLTVDIPELEPAPPLVFPNWDAEYPSRKLRAKRILQDRAASRAARKKVA